GSDLGGSGAAALAAAPGITVSASRFAGPGVLLVDLLVECGACSSKSDARRQLAAGAITVNDKRVASADPEVRLTATDVQDGQVIIRRGKKHVYVVRVS